MAIIAIPTLIALLFWFILGKKEKGGNIAFNIMLTIMLISQLSMFGKMLEERQKPVSEIKKEISKYEEDRYD